MPLIYLSLFKLPMLGEVLRNLGNAQVWSIWLTPSPLPAVLLKRIPILHIPIDQPAIPTLADFLQDFVESYIHRNFGVIDAMMGKKRAVEHLKKAIAVMPTNATARYLCLSQKLGMVHLF